MTNEDLTIILPFFNEVDFLPATLNSLQRQTDRNFSLLLVDNNSTDGGAELASEIWRGSDDIQMSVLTEKRQGKIFALQTGLANVATRYVATVDADTHYPEDYVARIRRGFRSPEAAAVIAYNVGSDKQAGPSFKQRFFARVTPAKCHSGGCAQAFNTMSLRAVGGFDPARWPYVLEDHEIIHRIGKQGRLVYANDHVCYPSDRRSDRGGCSWTALERIAYKMLPETAMDWFFYRYLAGRFARDGKLNDRLADQPWQDDPLTRP